MANSNNTASYFLLFAVLLLGGCSTVHYTVDDGRAIDPVILQNIGAFARGEQSIRPAIFRSGEILDKACDKQWELPISVATSYEFPQTERVAWVRVAKVDEHLTVVASAMTPQLQPGDKIEEIDGFKSTNTAKMAGALVDRHSSGQPFVIRTDAGKLVKIKPF